MGSRAWILTDIECDNPPATFAASHLDVPGSPRDWTVDTHTFRGGLSDGVELITVCNGPLTFDILPTRGMGLWSGAYRGSLLGWGAPVVGPVHPKYVNLTDRNGIGWLAGFDEWLCRCGLASNGPPGDDGGAPLTLHGRIANLPAHRVELRVDTEPPYTISVTGVVEEGGLFLGRLRLTTTYITIPGSNRIAIHDVVENLSARPAEMQMLYHLNMGEPFLEAGSKLLVPFREMAPHTAHAAKALESFDTFAGPVVGFAEEVFDFLPVSGADGRTLALFRCASGDKGLAIRWNVRELPCFTLWKNTAARADGYVAGLEPGTNFPYFKTHERSRGRVPTLPPSGRWEAAWSIEIADSADEVALLSAEVAALQGGVTPTVHQTPVFGP